jgi:hypothetical protein
MPSLARFGVFDKPDEPPPFVDQRLAGQLLAERRKMPNFLSSRRASPMVCSERMKNRTPHAVDVMGGRSSAIIRRISANRFWGMATGGSNPLWAARQRDRLGRRREVKPTPTIIFLFPVLL